MSVLKKEPLQYGIQYSRADKTLQLTVIKLPSEQLKSYDSISMPSASNTIKHKLSQLRGISASICLIQHLHNR